MNIIRNLVLAAGFSAGLTVLTPPESHAGSVIFNNSDPAKASIALGVNNEGHLNFFDDVFQTANAGFTGLAFRFPDGSWQDATAPGCLCEGWGLAVTDATNGRVAGWVNESSGSGGLLGGLFGATTTTASSSTQLADALVGIQHFYGISLVPNVFQGNVVITNSGPTAVGDVVYRRVMDWDVPPTEFSEFVTHSGIASNLEPLGGNLRFASNDGFATSDPRVMPTDFYGLGTVNADFDQLGPTDHGSVFDFAFGDLAAGASRTFNIFYGAANNLAEALTAVATLSPDLYSIGQSSSADGPADDAPVFLFGFKGVGGEEIGLVQENPILPFVPAPGEFVFPSPTPRRWFDPPFVTKFDYSLDSGEFLSFILPSGFSGLDLIVGGTTFSDLISDGIREYFFLADFGLTGVTDFSIADINTDPLVGVDAADPLAFPTFLDFTGAGTLTMKADLTTEVPGPLPVLGCGAAFSFSRRLRSRIKLSKLSVS
jgi:hypothetical protein